MKKTVISWWIAIALCTLHFARCTASASEQEDTMLMFVGESLDVLSIASRREESAWQAPAVAQVIQRKDLKIQGAQTLGQALSLIPGFHIAQKEWGTMPYLRGIPNSVLFLYDTVPLGLDTSKSFNPLENELSLASVKRIEIIRGPGSVLWGPDAFAGIVNIVPLSGKDLDGVETGIIYEYKGNQKEALGGFYMNAGYDNDLLDAFLSISGRRGKEDDNTVNLIRFWGENGKPVEFYSQRIGEQEIDSAHYLEASARVSFQDFMTISGRVSDNLKPYAMSDSYKGLKWQEHRSSPSGMMKIEAQKDLGQSSALRLMSSYSLINPEYRIIDLNLSQEESTFYSELIYDRSFFARSGLLTIGISYREKEIKDALIWEAYAPDFWGPTNDGGAKAFVMPTLKHEDYKARLRSLFAQYSHKIGNAEVWAGIRDDEHDVYQDHFSYNIGAVWSPSSLWIVKLLYGTAYRTPFARQLLSDEKPDLENINSISWQLSWKPLKQAGLYLTLFNSRIDNHIMEDPYAGLSVPNHQNIIGGEFEASFSPTEDIDLFANMTILLNEGPDETYRHNIYNYYDKDGNKVEYYVDISYPYDTGPEQIVNIGGTWRPFEKTSMFISLGYVSSTELIFPRGETSRSFSGRCLLNMNMTIQDILGQGTEIGISFRNLTAQDYATAGTYSAIDGYPFSAEIVLMKKW